MVEHLKIFDAFLPGDFCEKIISRFNQDSRVAPDPQPNYSTRRYLYSSQHADWFSLNQEICRYVNLAMTEYFKRPDELAHGTYHEWGDDGYVVSKYAPGDGCIMHVDGQTAEEPHNTLRIATLIFYLNDVDEGGETYFPLQNLKVKPKKGRAVAFPVGYTHPHEVLVTKTDRYIVQSWITDPNFVVQKSEHWGQL